MKILSSSFRQADTPNFIIRSFVNLISRQYREERHEHSGTGDIQSYWFSFLAVYMYRLYFIPIKGLGFRDESEMKKVFGEGHLKPSHQESKPSSYR